MEKTIEPLKSLLTTIKEDFLIIHDSVEFKIFPQMPKRQIDHFITQATNRIDDIILQINPSPFSNQVSEVLGTLTFSPTSEQIILKAKESDVIHLIQLQSIRHIRLA